MLQIFAINVFMFGVMTFATMGVKSAGALQAVRFILGCFEGVNTAGGGLIVSQVSTRNSHKSDNQPLY